MTNRRRGGKSGVGSCAALWAIASRQTTWQGSFAHILRAFTRRHFD
jgi:hypothetical protein